MRLTVLEAFIQQKKPLTTHTTVLLVTLDWILLKAFFTTCSIHAFTQALLSMSN